MLVFMNVRKIVSCCLICCVSFVVSSCARVEISSRAVSYNDALSDFGNQQVLLNAVRAAKRYPMYFSAVGSLTAKGAFSSTIQTQFPFKTNQSNKLPAFNINPSLTVSSGIASFAIANLNQEEFRRNLFNEVKPKFFKAFFDNDWPKELLFSLFLEEIAVTRKMSAGIRQEKENICDKKIRGFFPIEICSLLDLSLVEYREECEEDYYNNDRRTFDDETVHYQNVGRFKCYYLAFQIFIRHLRLLGMELSEDNAKKSKGAASSDDRISVEFIERYKKGSNEDVMPREDCAEVVTPKNKEKFSAKKRTVTEKKDGKKIVTYFEASKGEGRKSLVITLPKLKNEKCQNGGRREKIAPSIVQIDKSKTTLEQNKVGFKLRSPNNMIRFLGELIAGQIFSDDPYVPMIALAPEFDLVPLFKVKEGIIGKIIPSSVHVKHEGRIYYIPKPAYGKRHEARSLQVLDIIQQVLVHQTKKEDLPETSTIQLVGN